ncbi:hypothetical protein HDU86_005048 [Geranomyces michiganensis]|nr:hypothetical protein HDU86_005048 [Geranomyces michiganensis]
MVSLTVANPAAGPGSAARPLPKGVSEFEVKFSALPVLVNALRGQVEEPVASHPTYSMLVEGEVVIKCTTPMTFDRLEWVFLGDRLRHAAFTIFDTATELPKGVSRYPLNFYIKSDYTPTLRTTFGGVRYGVAAKLYRSASDKPSFMQRIRAGPGSRAVTTTEAELLVRRIVVRAEDLPSYSAAQGGGVDAPSYCVAESEGVECAAKEEDGEEMDNVQVVTELLKYGSVRVESVKRIVFLDGTNSTNFELAVALQGFVPDAKATIKQVQYGIKEDVKCM